MRIMVLASESCHEDQRENGFVKTENLKKYSTNVRSCGDTKIPV